MSAPREPAPGVFPVRLPRPAPLVPGVLVKRYKRFLADIALESGEVITAHCVNTGAMEGLTRPGIRVWVSRASNPARKLAWTWEMAEVDGRVYGVDTSAPNRLVGHLLRERLLPDLADYDELAPERRYAGGQRRADFWMRRAGRELWVEVKNCHLIYPDGCAYFPDCVSERAAAHMEELTGLVGSSQVDAWVIFVVQVEGARLVRPSDVHDPAFARAARLARTAGVRFMGLRVVQTPEETVIEDLLPVDLDPYPTADIEQWRAEAQRQKRQQEKQGAPGAE